MGPRVLAQLRPFLPIFPEKITLRLKGPHGQPAQCLSACLQVRILAKPSHSPVLRPHPRQRKQDVSGVTQASVVFKATRGISMRSQG